MGANRRSWIWEPWNGSIARLVRTYCGNKEAIMETVWKRESIWGKRFGIYIKKENIILETNSNRKQQREIDHLIDLYPRTSRGLFNSVVHPLNRYFLIG